MIYVMSNFMEILILFFSFVGLVTDKFNVGISNARIIVKNEWVLMAKTKTKRNGSFVINLPQGETRRYG